MPVPFRPAVFACPMRHVHGKEPEMILPSPFYPAWPELVLPSTFYTLPTLCLYDGISMALYWPPQCYWNSEDLLWREHIFENATLINELGRKYGVKYSQLVSHGIGIRRSRATGGSFDKIAWDTFAYFHDLGHYTSFKIGRATTEKVGFLTSPLFDLLRPANVAQCGDFWNKFEICNGSLVDFLEKSLVFEEIRANLFALNWLNRSLRLRIEDDVRDSMSKDGSLSLFDEISEYNRGNTIPEYYRYITAWERSFLGELYEPENPILGWQRHRNFHSESILNGEPSLIDGSLICPRTGWELEFVGSTDRTPVIKCTSPDGGEIDIVNHLNLSDVRELVFLESLRQQLAQFFGVSLVCPFQQRGHTCCGFGHYLRAVWEQVRPEYRSTKAILHPETGKEIVVRPPRKACLNYCLG